MDRTGRRYTQFKGIKAYKDTVKDNDKLLTAYEKIIASSKAKNEIKGKINDIKIDEEWILKLEEYLPYISACIQENRKFIKNQGETVPIEKVKKVGRDSVIDLAMHSKNIRTINENDEIEPSKILIVEKLDDYSVYENKFLVFLLNYIKSFVEIRFSKIREAKSLYETKTHLTNQVNLFHNTISYDIEINDKRFRDLNLEENDKNTILIQRIRKIEVVINQLLHTELIEQVSKTPSIRPPIQKTNVLKNDVNFVKAVELYEFISNYGKPGFEIIPIETTKTEFSKDYLDYFSMIPTLLTFLSYAEIKDLFALYEEELKKEITELRELELEKNIRKIHEMIGKEELDTKLIYRYVINMEAQKIYLDEKVKELELAIITKTNELTDKYEKEINLINQKHSLEIESINLDHQLEINKLNDEHDNEIHSFENKIEEINNEFDKEKNLLNTKIDDLNKNVSDLEFSKQELSARLRAKEIKEDSEIDENENSVDYFNTLEAEKKAFDDYFNKKWSQVKKNIMAEEKKKAIKEVKQKKNRKKEKKVSE